jgi:hypothetical protein
MTKAIGGNPARPSPEISMEVSTWKVPAWKREVRPKEAAQIIGCSVGYVYSLLNDGILEGRKLTRRGYERGIRLISVASIEKFLVQPPQDETTA